MTPVAAQIRLVVFDWAGTAVDHGCLGPIAAFMRVFEERGVNLTIAQVRGPMGVSKREHLRMLLGILEVAQSWRRVHGHDATDREISELYDAFVPRQIEVIERHSKLVPELLDCVAHLRRGGIRIATTTGYFRDAAARVEAAATRQGFTPDHSACVDDVPAGRPEPWMIFNNMEALGIYPPAAVVKVGDTVHDIAEGLNAGAWSIGVTRSSNEVGCTEAEWDMLPANIRTDKLAGARATLERAGAHVVLETLDELPGVIASLNDRLQRGERP